jgi:CHASE1-domain containing sensor protein
MRKDVNPHFALFDEGPGGVPLPAESRAIAFSLTSMEPDEYSASILGLDFASVPRLRSAIDHAVSSGKITASAAVDLPFSASGNRIVWSFMAAYRGAYASASKTSRTGLMGVCAIAHRIDRLVERSLRGLNPVEIDLELRDADAPAAEQVLYSHVSRETRCCAPSAPSFSRT